MKELLIFQFTYRKKSWIFSTIVCTCMLIPYLLQQKYLNITFLVLIVLYANLLGKFFNAKTEKEFIPSVALPFSKRSFIAYLLIRTVIFYCIIGVFSIVTVFCINKIFPESRGFWKSLPFLFLFFTVIQSLSLVLDSLTSMKGGAFINLAALLFFCPSMDFISSYITTASPKGIFIPLKTINQITAGIFNWGITYPLQAIILSITVGILCSVFVLAYANRIKME